MSKHFLTGITVIILGIICLPNSLLAQKITNTHWYFGNSSEGIVFNKNGRNPIVVNDQITPFGSGNGSTVISDKDNGNLLFYSDGQYIYDNTHALLPGMGPSQLSANLSLPQPVISCQVPDSNGKYLLFTHTGSAIEYSLLDPSLPGNTTVTEFPLGDIDPSVGINQSTGLNDQASLLFLTQTFNNQRFWLITQNASTLAFEVSSIGSTGITNTNSYELFPTGSPSFEASAIAVKEDSVITLAITPKETNRNTILVTMDPITGALSFVKYILNSGFDDSGSTTISDVEWSGDGSKLYLSRTGDSTNLGQVYQFDFSDTVNSNPLAVPILDSALYRSYGLQTGPDGSIYHLYQLLNGSPYTVGRITRSDSTVEADVLYDSLVFTTDFNGTQFPQFAPGYQPNNYFTLDFSYFGDCTGNETKFIAQVDPLPNNYYWDFGDGSGGQGPLAIHALEGASFVTLIAELNEQFQTITLPVEIRDITEVDIKNENGSAIPDDTTICPGEILLMDAGSGYHKYIWNTGEVTQKIEISDTSGVYWVAAIDTLSGCTSFDKVNITVYGDTSIFYHQWYFGDGAGLDFNASQPPTPLTDGQIDAPEGCATISDDKGQLLFYSNGSTVWNNDHQVMINGTDLGGDSTAAQSAMIMPFPSDPTLYYIFTTEEVYGDFTFNMKMSIVDLKADSARGEVLIKNIPIIQSSTERITASGFTGNPWMLAHEYGNNNFRAYQINTDGLLNASHSYAGKKHSYLTETHADGYMKISSDLSYIGVLIPGDTNYVNILDFDVTTGKASNSRLVRIDETDPVYGLEFASNRLYITTKGSNSKLLQYDLDSINSPNAIAEIEASKFELSSGSNYGALQVGPDGIIYMAIDGQTSLGTINSPSADDLAANYQSTGQDLSGKTSQYGLPNFIQQVGHSPQSPSFSYSDVCVGLPTQFSATGRDASIEEYSWSFGDGLGSVEQNPVHTYGAAGTYPISLTLTNRCDTAYIFYDTLEVHALPDNPIVPQDTALCGAGVLISAWPTADPTLSYYWSTGDTTRTISVLSPTIVDVAILNQYGCSSDTTTIFIGQDEPDLDLGPDQLLCENDTLILDANDPGPNFYWFRNDIQVGTERTQKVNTKTPGTYTYRLEIINDFTGCTYRDTIEITINPAPDIVQTAIESPHCGKYDGAFSLDISSTGNYIYELSGNVSKGPFNADGPGVTSPIDSLSAGSYTALVTNSVTGCSAEEIVQLEDIAPFDMEAIANDQCAHDGEIIVQFTDRIPRNIEINVLDELGVLVYNTNYEVYNRSVSVNDLDTGLYYVEVQDLNQPYCIQTDTAQLSISIACYRQIFVPNAFSPIRGGGTGLNDEWFAFPSDYVDSFEIFVFNRWGKVIFHSTDKNFRWNGTFGNGDAPPGTYAYRMLFTTTLEPDHGQFEQKGSVTVVR